MTTKHSIATDRIEADIRIKRLKKNLSKALLENSALVLKLEKIREICSGKYLNNFQGNHWGLANNILKILLGDKQ